MATPHRACNDSKPETSHGRLATSAIVRSRGRITLPEGPRRGLGSGGALRFTLQSDGSVLVEAAGQVGQRGKLCHTLPARGKGGTGDGR